MTEFPELQHALVVAARARYGRAARTWRVVRPVLVVAACAGIVLAVVAVAGRHAPDEQVPSPAASPAPDALRSTYSVLTRPATAADALPDADAFRENAIMRADRAGFDPSQARLVAQDGSWRMYLDPLPFDGHPAVCAFLTFDGRYASRGGCGVVSRPPMDPGDGGDSGADMVRDYSFAPDGGRPAAIVLVVSDGVDAVTVTFADRAPLHLAVRDNAVFYTPLESWPLSIQWDDPAGGRHTKPTRSFPSGPPPDGFPVPPERLAP